MGFILPRNILYGLNSDYTILSEAATGTIPFVFDTRDAQSGSTAVFSVRMQGTELLKVDSAGNVTAAGTVTAGAGTDTFAQIHVTGTSALDGAITAGSTLALTGQLTSTPGTLMSSVANAGTNQAWTLDTTNAMTGTTVLWQLNNQGTRKFSVDNAGVLKFADNTTQSTAAVAFNGSAATYTATDSTSGDTALSLKSNTWIALDGTAVLANTPTYGLRYNSAATQIEFHTAATSAHLFIDGTGVGRVVTNSKLIVGNDQASTITSIGAAGGAATPPSIKSTGTAAPLLLAGSMADGATSLNIILDGGTTFANTSAKLVSVRNNTVEEAYFDQGGQLVCGLGIATGGTKSSLVIPGNTRFAVDGTVNSNNYLEFTTSNNHLVLSPIAEFSSNIIADANIQMAGSAPVIQVTATNNGLVVQGNANDLAGSINITLDTKTTTLTNATARLVKIANAGTEEVSFDTNGRLTWGATQYANTNPTAGAVTISKVTGRSKVASGTSLTTVTNTLVSATSIVLVKLETTAAGVANLIPVPGAGSFTVTSVNGTGAVTNTTADATFSFVVFNV